MSASRQSTPAEQFVEKLTPTFKKEFWYYTHPNVQATAHQVGSPFKDSWTNILSEKNVIQRPVSVERFTELERTLSSLYCFELTLQDQSYEAFTDAQKTNPNEMLSRENYDGLCADVKQVANSDAYDVLTCLITYSDLGKSPVTRALAKQVGIDPTLDTDDLMLKILNLSDDEVIKILPSFAMLSPIARDMIRKAYPIMTACFGHLYFLEGGPKTLETIANALLGIDPAHRKELLELVFLAQFFDGVGSQGQLNMSGSVTCNNNFYRGYMLMRETLRRMEESLTATNQVEKSVAVSLDFYLQERAAWLQLQPSQFRNKADFEVVLRLACTLRFYDSQSAQMLVASFYKLPDAHRDLLSQQLSFDSEKGINSFARTPHYVATAAMNNSREAFNKKDVQTGIERALNAEICLAMLVKEISETYPESVKNDKMPMSFGKIAFRASEPNFFNPETFDATLARWAVQRPQPQGPIKNLIFDLGHVFIKIDTTGTKISESFSKLARAHGKDLSPENVKEIFSHPETRALSETFHRGKIPATDFRKIICDKLGLENITNAEFDTAYDASILASEEEVQARLDYLDQLAAEGYNIYLLSNNNEIHRIHTKQHYDGLHWGKYFFKQYYSNETGLYKPDAQGYKQILQENQLKASETLFFDDVKKYVNAAWKQGIRARQFDVNHPMSNVKLMIEAITKNHQHLILPVTRLDSLTFFAFEKWKRHKRLSASSPPVQQRKP